MRRFKPYLEWKYLVNEKQKYLFKKHYLKLLENDPNSIDGNYIISTIYFDTENFDLYQDKLEGEFYKLKIRIRRYLSKENNAYVSPKIELKIKKGDETIKFSKLINDEMVERLCLGNISGIELYKLLPVNEQIIKNLLIKNIFNPVSGVEYNRTAWFFPVIPDLRITIDKNIKVFRPDNRLILYSGINDVDNILEIKSNTKIPICFQNTLKSLNTEKQAFSKYSHSIEKIYKLL